MQRHYKHMVLLIEFDEGKAFALQHVADLQKDISFKDLSSKIVLLALHFPKLRMVWTRSPLSTANVFLALKEEYGSADVDKAVAIGGGSSDISGMYNAAAEDMLLMLPGINLANYKQVMHKVKNIRELAHMELAPLQALIGVVNGRLLWKFFNVSQT